MASRSPSRRRWNVQVFRSSDAFLIQKIYLCGITAQPPHKDIHRTALGSTESVDWEYRKEAAELLREIRENCFCIAVEQTENAIQLQQFLPAGDKPIAVVFGNEVKGVSQEVVNLCHQALEIPQFGTKHSLNVAVSAGVVLWDLWSKMNAEK